ncbi:MAG: RAMP superfamily CRISPR-associated protein [Candidatus Nitrosocaldaceae archaeon]
MSYNINLSIEMCANKKLSIGGLSNKIIADVEFTKINNKPFIPASTIKGVLRTSMIKISHLLTNNIINPSINPSRIGNDLVSSIMGKPHNNIYSKVRVSNGILSSDKDTNYSFVLSHVSINDITGIAEDNALYEREYVFYMSKFKFELDASSLTLEEARLLFFGLLEMRYQRIGRNGLVDIKIKDARIPDELKNDRVVAHILKGLR